MWAHVVDQLSPNAARVWRGPLVAIGTYSFGGFEAFAAVLAAESGGRSDETLSGMYEYIADRSLNALYQVLFRLVSPSFVIGNYPTMRELTRSERGGGVWAIAYELRQEE